MKRWMTVLLALSLGGAAWAGDPTPRSKGRGAGKVSAQKRTKVELLHLAAFGDGIAVLGRSPTGDRLAAFRKLTQRAPIDQIFREVIENQTSVQNGLRYFAFPLRIRPEDHKLRDAVVEVETEWNPSRMQLEIIGIKVVEKR